MASLAFGQLSSDKISMNLIYDSNKVPEFDQNCHILCLLKT